MNYTYDHFGVPVQEKWGKMTYYPEYKVWCSDYENDPLRIEWIFFEEGSPMHPLIRTIPHVCFLVEDIEKAVFGKTLLLKPTESQGFLMAFIEEQGVPVEFFQLSGNKASWSSRLSG